jgi:hypothetical protein
MISSTSDLSTRLLCDHQAEGDGNVLDYDEEEGCVPCSLKLESQSSSDRNKHIYILLFVLVLFYLVLFETFGVAFHASPFRLLKATCNTIIFVIVAYLYKQAMKDYKPTCSILVLLPEVLQIVILSVITFGNVDAAFLLLSISNFCLAVLAVVAGGI